jgi:L-cystine uptake protein TcyP (sodium:dicarboxylate symporter family)
MTMVGALETSYENEKQVKISLFCVFFFYYFIVFVCLVCVIFLLKLCQEAQNALSLKMLCALNLGYHHSHVFATFLPFQIIGIHDSLSLPL